MLHKVEGVVIRGMDYGEGNKIIRIMTKEKGKISMVVRGAKKLKSRHSALTQLFTYAQFVYYKSSQMGTLQHGELLSARHAISENLHMSAYGAYLLEMTDRLMEEGEPNSYIYDQLQAALEAIEEGKDLQIITHLYEMKMLQSAGYMPDLTGCRSCSAEEGELWLHPDDALLQCGKCGGASSRSIRLGAGALKLLRLFQRMDVGRLGAVEVREETRLQLKSGMRALMDSHVDIPFKSRSFIEQMDKYGL